MLLYESEYTRVRSSYSYLFTMLGILYSVSLMTGGFVDVLYYTVQPFYRLPYLFLALNILGLIISIPMITKYVRKRIHPVVAATADSIILFMVIGSGYMGIFLLITMMVILLFINEDEDDREISKLINTGLVFLIIFMVIASISLPLGYIQASHHVTPRYSETVEQLNGVNRLLPLYTAYIYGVDRIQSPTHTIVRDDSYIYYDNRTPIYNWIIEPEGFWNSLTKKPSGVLLVDGDKYPPNVTVINHPLKYSFNKRYFKLLFFDTLQRQGKLHGIGGKVLFDENVEVLYKGKIYTVIPVIKWKRGVLWNLAIPWKYIVISEGGKITVKTFNEAKKDPLFKKIPLLPEEVAREWVGIYRYHRGFVEYYFHHNYYEIRDVGDNRQPYLTVSNDNKMYWVFIAEPAGKTYSVKYVIYIPADQSNPTINLYKPSTLLIGVSKVVSYVKSAHPRFDWSTLKIVEPIPTVTNNTIYWTVKIITKDDRGLVAVDLINAKTSKVTSIPVSKENGISSTDILKYVTTPTATQAQESNAKNTNVNIRDEIKEIKREINQTINQLNQLYQKLNQLEEKLGNQTKT